MSAADPKSNNRSVIDDLLAKQDQVIRELDELDEQLLATIEAFKASKEQGTGAAEEEQSVALQAVPAKKAA